jgi:hypothetical protein
MLPRLGASVAFATVAIALVIAPAAVGQGSELEMYTLRGSGDKIAKGAAGVELAGQRQTASGLKADAVLTRSQVAKLRASGVRVSLLRNKRGRTVTQQARAMAVGGFNVYRSWDEPGGIRDELFDVAAQNPQIVKLEVLGQTHQGRDLIALKLTQAANNRPGDQDNWTTLPDQNGHTSSDLSNDRSCPGGWSNPNDAANVLHPFLTHYQTFQAGTPATCSSTGSTGSPPGQWNAANGSSSGWQQWQIDLGPYANQQVEVSITALSDWGFQQFPGVFIDDIAVSTGEGTTSFEDDADPMDGWTIPDAPQDPAGVEEPNRNDWVRRGGLGIKEGSVVRAADTLYMGFGFEGIAGATTRNDVMGRVIDYLGG